MYQRWLGRLEPRRVCVVYHTCESKAEEQYKELDLPTKLPAFRSGERTPLMSGTGAANTGEERRFGERAITARVRLEDGASFIAGRSGVSARVQVGVDGAIEVGARTHFPPELNTSSASIL